MIFVTLCVCIPVYTQHYTRFYKYIKQNHIYLIKSVQFQTLMNVKRFQAFVQMVCASTRSAVFDVNALQDSVTMIYSWSVKVISMMYDLYPHTFGRHKWFRQLCDLDSFVISLQLLSQYVGVDHQIVNVILMQ